MSTPSKLILQIATAMPIGLMFLMIHNPHPSTGDYVFETVGVIFYFVVTYVIWWRT